ncbi:hypothetical protein [Halorubrum sp. AS12]|uniref:hypothetical protein n=1 Tax=Halorubrum sp. AS12 TaxID=3409687 RepID=UPI003DA7642E
MRSWLPTSSPTPPQLEAEIPHAHLHQLLEPLVVVDGQTILNIGGDALVATSVDEQVVTAVEATLHKSLCHSYEAVPGSIAIDAGELLNVLTAERNTGVVQLHYDSEDSTLQFTHSSFVHTQTVAVDVAVEKPEIDGSPDTTTYHQRNDLAHALQYFTDHASVVAFGYDDSKDECYLEEATIGDTALETTTRFHCPREQLPGANPTESVRSAFSTTKLYALVESVPPETLIRADYTETFPLRLSWDLTGGDGIDQGTLTEVSALLAPYEVPDTPTAE